MSEIRKSLRRSYMRLVGRTTEMSSMSSGISQNSQWRRRRDVRRQSVLRSGRKRRPEQLGCRWLDEGVRVKFLEASHAFWQSWQYRSVRQQWTIHCAIAGAHECPQRAPAVIRWSAELLRSALQLVLGACGENRTMQRKGRLLRLVSNETFHLSMYLRFLLCVCTFNIP